jgi:hypothetical protein
MAIADGALRLSRILALRDPEQSGNNLARVIEVESGDGHATDGREWNQRPGLVVETEVFEPPVSTRAEHSDHLTSLLVECLRAVRLSQVAGPARQGKV